MLRSVVSALVLVLFAPFPAFAQGGGPNDRMSEPDMREEYCGWVFPVASYHAEIAGLRIALTANDRLVVNGRLLAEDSPYGERGPFPWEDSANTARVARTARHVLVLTHWTDCIDYAFSRIYVLDPQGSLVASSALWSEHHRDGFFTEGDSIVYWSDFFCRDRGAPTRVYVLKPGAREFVQENRPWDAICSEKPQARMGSDLYFASMRPQSPRADATR